MPRSRYRIDALAKIARDSCGLFTLADARDCGFSHQTVRRMVTAGRWREEYPLVYCDATRPKLDWYAELVAVQLSAPSATITGASALALYNVVDAPRPPHVIVPRSKRNLDRTVVHSSIELPEMDTVEVRRLRATRPSRSLIIAADLLTIGETEGWRPAVGVNDAGRRLLV